MEKGRTLFVNSVKWQEIQDQFTKAEKLALVVATVNMMGIPVSVEIDLHRLPMKVAYKLLRYVSPEAQMGNGGASAGGAA